MSAVSNNVTPASRAASTTPRVPSRSTRMPKLLQPRPTTETSGPSVPNRRVRTARDGRASGMRYRSLGSSDLEVSEISLGSWLTYGGGVPREQAEACVAKAFEVGINFIDTANVYGRGGAEELLGEVLADRPRDSYILATKLFWPMNGDQGLSRPQVFKQLDASLARLRTDFVDLYQCHRYDFDTPLEETMEALTEVVREGKTRYIGFSEWTAEQIQAALDLVPQVEKFVSSQPQYSLLYRVPEDEVIPLCAANGISQIVWSPLAQGALTGKYKPGEAPPPDSRASSQQM